MMNTATLTDDELVVVMVALHTVIAGVDKYKKANGGNSLGLENDLAYEEMKTLHNRLNSEYF